MRGWLILVGLVASFVVAWSTAAAESGVISAATASGKVAVPSGALSQTAVRTRFTGLVLNESGWRSGLDANGILRSLVTNARLPDKQFDLHQGEDRARLLRYMARIGNRTFPVDNPLLGLVTAADRQEHTRRQRLFGNAYWTSGFKLDCSKPDHWDEVYPDSQWAGYTERCKELVLRAQAALANKLPNTCHTAEGVPADPTWWGGAMDLHRVENGWEEIFCDAPGKNCTKEDRMSRNTPEGCTKNWYFRIKPKQ